MTTIKRPPKRRQQGITSRRCAMFGIAVAVLIALHLLVVGFLYRRVPVVTEQQTHLWHNADGKGGLETFLMRSRESLRKPPPPPAAAGDGKQDGVKTLKEMGRQRTQRHERPVRANKKKKRKDMNTPAEEEIPDRPETKGQHDGVNEEEELPTIEERGSRATDVSYIADFVFDREHPHFRTHEVVLPPLEDVDDRLQSLHSCSYISNHRILSHAACRQGSVSVSLAAFNHQSFPVSWCGKTIAPNTMERFDEPCREPVRLLTGMTIDDAPISGEGMPPEIITVNKGSTNLQDVECDIPCQQEVGIDRDATSTLFIEGTEWEITTTPRDPFSVRAAQIELNDFRNDKYFSTSSFSSSVPLSPFSFDDYNFAAVEAVNFDDTLLSASYLVSSACSSQGSKRHRWVGAVEKHFPVAYYGSCSHNTDLPQGMSLKNKDDRAKLHRKHRFNLAFESSNEKDYMTQIIFDAFQSGSLPVILGPANIDRHFPPNSFINAGRFQYWEQLGEYVKEVAGNKTLWESYHEWRKDPKALQAFNERFAFTRTDPSCRMCRWAYAKRYGLGWNHTQQVVQETELRRSLCMDSVTSLVTRPFVESYAVKVDASYSDIMEGTRGSSACDSNEGSLHSRFSTKGFQVERDVQAHDGVTDLIFENVDRPNAEGDFILRLEFGVKNVDGSFFRNPHTLVSTIRGPLCSSIAIQDEQSKVTVVANWETEMISTKEGVIEIVVGSGSEYVAEEDEIRRLRIIVEDSSFVHDKMTEYFPSSYAKMMIQDAIDPLELFYSTN